MFRGTINPTKHLLEPPPPNEGIVDTTFHTAEDVTKLALGVVTVGADAGWEEYPEPPERLTANLLLVLDSHRRWWLLCR